MEGRFGLTKRRIKKSQTIGESKCVCVRNRNKMRMNN